jgi:DNA polymerase III sliding clamp (beta) subunit (PCNA family)
MKMKINMDTTIAAKKITDLAQKLPDTTVVTITDNQGLRVNAKSMLGMLYALEFNELWLESNIDCWSLFKEFEAE